MVAERNLRHRILNLALYAGLAFVAFVCIIPFLHVIAISLSSNAAIKVGVVGLWPVRAHLSNYRIILRAPLFTQVFLNSVLRVLSGVSLTLVVTLLTAYPLSLDKVPMIGRTAFKMVMLFGSMFAGGMIPTYLAYRSLGLLDRFAVLVLPGALGVYYVILVMNYFRGIPSELCEAAVLDGANHLGVLFRVYLPLSRPVLATVALFGAVDQWNSWFDGVLYLNDIRRWPLQSYLYARVTSGMLQKAGSGGALTAEGLATAMILVASLPIIVVYPFLQRFFVTGLTLGAVKG